MKMVSITAARARILELVEMAAAGEDVILTRRGKPVARITQLRTQVRPIKFGLLAGKVRISDDFDAPLPDAAFREFEAHIGP